MTDPIVTAVETVASPFRLYIELAAAAVLLGGFGLFTWHERSVGATAVHTADANAMIAARKLADTETVLNQERAAKADAGAAGVQKAVDDYRTAHPEQPMRLCVTTNNRLASMPKAGAADGIASSPGAGSLAVPEVPGRGEGADIGPSLDAIVRAAQRVDVLYADRQQR